MNRFTRGLAALAALAASALNLSAAETAAKQDKYNVLFIAVDDLRPETGAYGNPVIKTPNLDALSKRGITFNRAYCQQAVCSPSRTSLLCGRRPDTTKVYDLQTHFRRNLPDVVTLPQQFKLNGYHVQGMGKIFHGGLDDPQSWSVPHWNPKAPGYGKPETLRALAEEAKQLREKHGGPASKVLERDPKTGTVLKTTAPKFRARGPAWEDPEVADNALQDGATADHAIETLRSFKSQEKPFFLAVGFLKPHLPFVAPKKYFDFYNRADLKLASNPFPPKDCPDIALHTWGELRAYRDIPSKGPLSDATALDLIHGYYAATSYTDAQIGRVVDELKNLGLDDKTIVIVWGDHGWQLGEHGLWCKHSNFEIAARVPMVLSVPGQKQPGARTDALVEFVDIYPTLCDLCGIPLPEGLEGVSLAPLLDDPNRPVKSAAFSQYPRGPAMGYSMRTDRYRYTEWQPKKPGPPVAVELYDHQVDPQENVNLANLPEHKALVAKLSKQLKAGWQAAQAK